MKFCLPRREEGDAGEYRPVIPTLVPEKVMENVVLESMTSDMKDQEVTGSSQHGLSKVNCA